MQAEKTLPGFATFAQEREPGPGRRAWGWSCSNDRSEASWTRGQTASNTAQHSQLHHTRNTTSSSGNLLGYLVNGSLAIHLRVSCHHLKLVYVQSRTSSTSRVFQHTEAGRHSQLPSCQTWGFLIPVHLHSSAVPSLPPLNTHIHTLRGSWSPPRKQPWPVRHPVLEVPPQTLGTLNTSGVSTRMLTKR